MRPPFDESLKGEVTMEILDINDQLSHVNRCMTGLSGL